MAGQQDALRVAAVLRRVVLGPTHGQGAILDEARIDHLGDQAVVGNDHQEAARRDGLGGPAIFRAAAGVPAAAVEEHHRGPGTGAGFGRVDVERAAGSRAVGDGVADVARRVARREGGEQVEDRAAAQRRRGGGGEKAEQAAAGHAGYTRG